ncbi:NAD kinase [Bifidobacterium crudilactis]|jgi:NAD+ kinase|uniref:NAD kinase n=3 Tax=Bifidobacterium crudilactis TaxID=327277 RepID=A0A971D0L0_9BIFI|nr:NAD kinase [Bifidobacterium crudilactis]MCI1868007.1 NAD kinase [Bifidobacterium crudilactis]MDN5971577.1 NAD kinase [Bifidobacterium crudilactis]MDN6001664.1 NAD kinase [Bifidobacterium crudilactis]MDN6209789.1 NAD kinase [Bifidobacterium crudilactis]MDN6234891.1 NAD kinase [Bifidobacterium crudilactis]
MGQRNAVVVTHSRLRSSGTVVREAVEQLKQSGFAVSIIDNLEAPEFGTPSPVVSEDTEIVVVLGGDGTILRAAELVKCTNVPILGVNLGHVGFLAEFESFQMSEAMGKIAAHDYSIDSRMIAHIDVWLPGAEKPISDWALNDVTLERSDRGKMVEVSIRVDDVEMSSFSCDGVIVATPTGSTAYAFSAGGPIIWPDVKALQLVPLAAHALFARPLIIGSDSKFSLDILDESTSDGWICCDGRRQLGLPRGTHIEVRESHDTLRLARLSGVPFTSRLVTKFDLPVVGWREHRFQKGARRLLNNQQGLKGFEPPEQGEGQQTIRR